MPYIGVSPQFGVRRKHTYTATAGQTSFSGAGSEGATLSYKDSNFVDVYQNGVKLGDADYTSTSGTAIVLAQGASVDDLIEIIVFDAFSAADTVSKADGGQFDGNVTMAGTLGVTGAVTANAGVNIDNITIDGTEIDLSSGDLTVDVAGDIILDADGSDIIFKDGGTDYGRIKQSSSDLIIRAGVQDKDIKLQGDDGGVAINALQLDMSEAGAATFNSSVTMSTSMIGESTDGQFEFISKDTSGSGSTDYGDFIFKGRRGADNDTVTIMNMDGATGRVGINTTSMAEPLRVQADSDTDFSASSANFNTALMLKNSTSGASNCVSLGMSTETNGEVFISAVQNSGNDAADLIFSSRASGARAERMRITSRPCLVVGVSGDTDARIYGSRGDAGSTGFFESTSSATSGTRAISTSLPQNSNNGNCHHLRSTTQNVATFGLLGNGTSTFSSDERLKKNIETTRDGYLEDLAKLRVVKYNWHCDDDSTDKELGLIAQEVQKVFPKLIKEDDVELNGIEKPLALKVSVLPMMLLKALQEANTKITALETRIAALEGK